MLKLKTIGDHAESRVYTLFMQKVAFGFNIKISTSKQFQWQWILMHANIPKFTQLDGIENSRRNLAVVWTSIQWQFLVRSFLKTIE